MIKKAIIGLACASALFASISCAPKPVIPQVTPAPAPPATATPAPSQAAEATPNPETEEAILDDGKIKLTDHAGRLVVLDAPVKKIVGTHNPTLNMAIVVDGNGSTLAGFGNKDMAMGLYNQVVPGYEGLTSIGKNKEINYETVVSLGADLALIPMRFKDQAEKFAEVNVPTIILNVEKFDSIKGAISLVGTAMGKEDRAFEIISFFDKKIESISKATKGIADKPKVMMLGSSNMASVAHDGMLQNQIIKTAGGIPANEGYNAKGNFVEVDVEQIIAWNPDVIYVPAYASYTVEDVLKAEAWKDITAVKEKKVFTFPSKLDPWDYPTASASLGLCWVAYNLHSEIYSFDDLIKDVDSFYKFVYGRTFTPQELGLN